MKLWWQTFYSTLMRMLQKPMWMMLLLSLCVMIPIHVAMTLPVLQVGSTISTMVFFLDLTAVFQITWQLEVQHLVLLYLPHGQREVTLLLHGTL